MEGEVIFTDINRFLEPSGYEVHMDAQGYYKQRGEKKGELTGLEKYFIETLLNEPSDSQAAHVLGLVKSELGGQLIT